MNSNLIITISIGHRPWFNNIKKYYQLYANKTNSDFMVIDDNFQGDIKSRLKKKIIDVIETNKIFLIKKLYLILA